MFNKKLLGERIKKVRGKKSQDVFAGEIGISRGALSYYENGEREPDAEIIYKICELCNVSADYLLGFTDNTTTDTDLKEICNYMNTNEETIEALKNNLLFFKFIVNKDEHAKKFMWIFKEQCIRNIISELETIIDSSESYLEEKEKFYNKFPNGKFPYDVPFGLLCTDEKIDKKLQREILTSNDQYNKFCNILENYEQECDLARYKIIKIIEKMSNHFDQREQVCDNGEHNPPKE